VSGPLPLALGGLAALAAAMGIGRFALTPILPFMSEALGLSAAEAGLLASSNFAGYLAGALFAVLPLAGRRRAWLLAGLAASALTTGLMAATGSYALLLALRFAGGFASALVLVFASTLVLERLAQAGRPGLSALHFAGVGIGIALAALLVGGLAQAGWRAQWLACGLASALALLVAALTIEGDGPPPARTAAAADGKPSGALALLVAAYGLVGFGYVVTATFITTIMRADPGLSPFEPAVWLVVGLAAAPSVALWNAVARRTGATRAFALAAAVEALGVAASVAPFGAAPLFAAAILLGGTFVGLTALGLVAARHLAPADPRRALALMTAAFGTGQIVGPAFAGLVAEATGAFTLPTLAAAAALALSAALAATVR